MALPFPSPTTLVPARVDVLLGYLDYFRSVAVDKLRSLSPEALTVSAVPSGWTPLELINHLTYVELRWLVWGFEGAPVAEPWGDWQDGRWHATSSLEEVLAALEAQAAASREVALRHPLDELGVPGERWDGDPPATLERVLLHLVQEWARHLGHLDVVTELGGGVTGE
jgi:uncharacterized damage-inducible protein DinB